MKYSHYLTLLIFLLVSVTVPAQVTETESAERKEHDTTPLFPGCDDFEAYEDRKACANNKLLQYIYKRLRYPAEARQKSVEGTAVVSFFVETDGSLTEFELLQDPGAGCGAAAMAVVESMKTMEKKWEPATLNGKAVRLKYTLPIKFKLEGGRRPSRASQIDLLNGVLSALAGDCNCVPQYKTIEQACEDGLVSCEKGKIVGLNLQLENLQGKIPREIVALQDLVWINLEYNYLKGSIPSGLSGLKNLEELLLTGNHLTEEKPSDYSALERLDYFDVSKNVPYQDFRKTKNSEENEEIFKVVERMPRFPGCEKLEGDSATKKECADEKLLQYIFKSIPYPAKARDNGVEGMVVMQFIVDKDGTIQDIDIKRDPGTGCGNASCWVIDRMNYLDERWTAGSQRGRNVKVLYTLPIKFKLD